MYDTTVEVSELSEKAKRSSMFPNEELKLLLVNLRKSMEKKEIDRLLMKPEKRAFLLKLSLLRTFVGEEFLYGNRHQFLDHSDDESSVSSSSSRDSAESDNSADAISSQSDVSSSDASGEHEQGQ